ncbi:hypothetical protein [Peribacillus sp. SCS-155]
MEQKPQHYDGSGLLKPITHEGVQSKPVFTDDIRKLVSCNPYHIILK